jgi:hypothetical protein
LKVRASERDASLLVVSQRAPPNFNEVKVENLSTSRFSYNKTIRTPFGEMNQRAASSTPLLFPCPFYSFAISVAFFKNFQGLENKFSTKRKSFFNKAKIQFG